MGQNEGGGSGKDNPLQTWVPKRIVSRLTEMGGANMSGTDYKVTLKKKKTFQAEFPKIRAWVCDLEAQEWLRECS